MSEDSCFEKFARSKITLAVAVIGQFQLAPVSHTLLLLLLFLIDFAFQILPLRFENENVMRCAKYVRRKALLFSFEHCLVFYAWKPCIKKK